MGYWGKVFKGAWAKTWQLLDWDRKKVAVAILGFISAVVTGIHLGWVAMIASATGIFWAAFPIAITALIIFIWGIFETQSELYASAMGRITELEVVVAESKEPPPNYDAYRHVEQLTLRDASFLWSDVRIRLSMPPKVQEHYAMLCGAVQNGNLKFEPELGDPYMRDTRIRIQRENPHLHTIVTRTHLKEFAAKFTYDPIFLRDA